MAAISLSVTQVSMLVAYALGMSVGQLLFKAAAEQLGPVEGVVGLLALFAKPIFLGAVALYGLLTLAWVWILTGVPLSKAYPFAMLALAFTPLLALLFFGESISAKYWIGLLLMCAGLALVVNS